MSRKANKEENIYYTTGSDLLDLVVGGGKGYGYEAGHIINIVGDKSSGKTALVVEMIACMRNKMKDSFKWNYNDAESGFTFDTKNLYGFDLMKDNTKTDTVENWYGDTRNFLENKIKSDEIGLYCLDSLDGLTSIEMKKRADERYKAFKKGEDYDKGSYQVDKAKFLSQEYFPMVAQLIEEKNSFLVIISQTRDKIGSMFKSKTRAGGKALDFYCHTIMWLREVCKIKKNVKVGNKTEERVVGILIEALTKKNKTARPFRKCNLSFLFDYGIDNIGDNIDYLFDLRTDLNGDLKKSADRIQWDNSKKEITLKNLIKFIKENEELEKRYGIEKPYEGLKGEDKIKEIAEWIKGFASKVDYKKLFNEVFGEKFYTRDELIQWIEQDENRVRELTKRVREKWESIEQEVASNRKRKYS